MKMNQKPIAGHPLSVKQADGEEVPRHVLATAIIKVSEAAESLAKSGLNERAIVVLLQDSTGASRTDIKAILHGLRSLRETFCS